MNLLTKIYKVDDIIYEDDDEIYEVANQNILS